MGNRQSDRSVRPPVLLRFGTVIGPECFARIEAILMSVVGRRGVVDELTGLGQETLARRIEGHETRTSKP